MLGLTAAVAIFFALAQAAGEGWAFAIAIQVAIGFLVACFALFAIVFLIAWTVSTAVLGNKPDTPQGSPFAADQLPPQIIPPREQRP